MRVRRRKSRIVWPPRLWTVNGWLILGGWVSLALGTVGALLPLLPTVPFYLLAAYLFSRGSKVLHRWIRSRRYIGPAIKDWENGHVIRTPAKWMATGGMALLSLSTLWFVYRRAWLFIMLCTIYSSVLIFIWTRPSKKTPDEKQSRPSPLTKPLDSPEKVNLKK
jgi:uncharacterized protein